MDFGKIVEKKRTNMSECVRTLNFELGDKENKIGTVTMTKK